jgi:hypothetical protein
VDRTMLCASCTVRSTEYCTEYYIFGPYCTVLSPDSQPTASGSVHFDQGSAGEVVSHLSGSLVERERGRTPWTDAVPRPMLGLSRPPSVQ